MNERPDVKCAITVRLDSGSEADGGVYVSREPLFALPVERAFKHRELDAESRRRTRAAAARRLRGRIQLVQVHHRVVAQERGIRRPLGA
jgi:hypothetical protein